MRVLIASRDTCRRGPGLSYRIGATGSRLNLRDVNGVRFATDRTIFWLTFWAHAPARLDRFVTDLQGSR